MNDPLPTQQKPTEGIRNHSFSSYAKFLEKLTFLTPWYGVAYVRVCIRGVRNVNFSEHFAYVPNEWFLTYAHEIHCSKQESILSFLDAICGALRDLVPLVQFKKREKHPWRSFNFSKVAGFKPGRKLNVHHTFRRHIEHLLNILHLFNNHPISRGFQSYFTHFFHFTLVWFHLFSFCFSLCFFHWIVSYDDSLYIYNVLEGSF